LQRAFGLPMKSPAPRRREFPLLASLAISLFASFALNAQDAPPQHTKLKNRTLVWNPPDVDSKLPLVNLNACDLPRVLQLAGVRTKDQEENLPNFTADERIQFQLISGLSQADSTTAGLATQNLNDSDAGTFEYLAVLSSEGGAHIVETRTPEKGSHAFPASTQDTGFPEMDFIFLPSVQPDYEMKCLGEMQDEGQPAWVIHFQQRPDRIGRTLSFKAPSGTIYSAKLKGRAWVSKASGDIMHLEFSMMEPIPQMHVRNSWLSIEYAPIQFHSQSVRIWLPQRVDSYAQFETQRTIIYHTFGNFLLFSVQTKQEFKIPTQPQ
jgi:hypothetical protein